MARAERKIQQLEADIAHHATPPPAARDARPHPQGEPARLVLADAYLYDRPRARREREIPRGRPPPAPGDRRHRERLRPAGQEPGRRARSLPDLALDGPRPPPAPWAGTSTSPPLYDPEKNTEAAALYLEILFATYADPQMVLAEYNGGPLNAGYFRADVGALAAETRQATSRACWSSTPGSRTSSRWNPTPPAETRRDRDEKREGKALGVPALPRSRPADRPGAGAASAPGVGAEPSPARRGQASGMGRADGRQMSLAVAAVRA